MVLVGNNHTSSRIWVYSSSNPGPIKTF
jgi:hypothetical protein